MCPAYYFVKMVQIGAAFLGELHVFMMYFPAEIFKSSCNHILSNCPGDEDEAETWWDSGEYQVSKVIKNILYIL